MLSQFRPSDCGKMATIGDFQPSFGMLITPSNSDVMYTLVRWGFSQDPFLGPMDQLSALWWPMVSIGDFRPLFHFLIIHNFGSLVAENGRNVLFLISTWNIRHSVQIIHDVYTDWVARQKLFVVFCHICQVSALWLLIVVIGTDHSIHFIRWVIQGSGKSSQMI